MSMLYVKILKDRTYPLDYMHTGKNYLVEVNFIIIF